MNLTGRMRDGRALEIFFSGSLDRGSRFQKRLQLPRRFPAETRNFRNLFHRRETDALDRAEFYQQRGFAPLADIGELIENAFRDAFQAELRIVSIGEPM